MQKGHASLDSRGIIATLSADSIATPTSPLDNPTTKDNTPSDTQSIHGIIHLANQDISALLRYTECPDLYTQKIEALLTQAEEKVYETAITNEEHFAIIRLFIIGHITTLALFRRYESLKQTEIKQSLRHLYRYGWKGYTWYHEKYNKEYAAYTKTPSALLSIGDLKSLRYEMK